MEIFALFAHLSLIIPLILAVRHNMRLQERIRKKDSDIRILISHAHALEGEIKRLNLFYYKNRSEKVSPEIVEAVKFAMAQAHPDKPNGSNEKFIKYRKVYDNIKVR